MFEGIYQESKGAAQVLLQGYLGVFYSGQTQNLEVRALEGFRFWCLGLIGLGDFGFSLGLKFWSASF